MALEQRIAKLECSANRYRLGCITLSLIILLRLSAGAGEAPNPGEKVIEADAVVCKAIKIVDANHNAVAALGWTPHNDAATLVLGNPDMPFNGIISCGKNDMGFTFGDNKRYSISAHVDGDSALLAMRKLEETVIDISANKKGSGVFARDMEGNWYGFDHTGILQGRQSDKRPKNR